MPVQQLLVGNRLLWTGAASTVPYVAGNGIAKSPAVLDVVAVIALGTGKPEALSFRTWSRPFHSESG